MNAATLLALVLVPTLAAPTALAHLDHSPCPYSTTLANGRLVHVDRWSAGCIGAAVSAPELVDCNLAPDVHFGGIHVFFLYGTGCQTGVILENLESDRAAPVPVLA